MQEEEEEDPVPTPKATGRHSHYCLPSPPLADPCAKPPDCYRPVPPSPGPFPPSLSLFLAFLFVRLFVLLFDFPKLESLWLQRKETCRWAG